MNNNHSNDAPKKRFNHIVSTIVAHKFLLIVPMLLGMLLAAVYVYTLRGETWSARQSLIIRDDLLVRR